MRINSHRAWRHGLMALGLVVVTAVAQTPAEGLTANEKAIVRELTFADKLLHVLVFPDYATKVLDVLEAKYPESKPRVQAMRITALTMRGKFDAAEKEIAALPQNALDTQAMKLALGDAYYAFGKVSKAQDCYEGFFKSYSNGPPAELKDLYQRSADRYAQMLILKGEDRAALQACRYFLLSKPDADLARQCKAQMGELCLRIAQSVQGDERKKLLAEGRQLCQDQMWKGQDSVFAKSVVVLAHIMVEENQRDEARKLIQDYLPMLKSIDDQMRQEKMSLKQSPMVECRFLLGVLLEEDGRKAYDGGDAVKGLALLRDALSQLYTVYTTYAESAWAPDAGKRADVLVAYLESKGRKVTLPKTDVKIVMDAQLKEARSLLRDQDYAGAKRAYLEVLRQYPQFADQPRVVTELAQACVAEGDELYAKALIGHLAERFHATRAVETESGNLLLNLAVAYEGMGNLPRASDLFDLFLERFPQHEKAPLVYFRMGDDFLRKEDFTKAERYYRGILNGSTNLPSYPAALSRAALCEMALEDYSNAVANLTVYVERLPPGAERAEALLRLGDGFRKMGNSVAAANQYGRLVTALEQDGARYAASAEDIPRNAKTRQKGLFWLAFCYSRLTEPADKVTVYRQKAVEFYTAVLSGPSKEFGANTLAALGTLYFLQDKPDEADKAYSRLVKDYPDAPESKSVLYTQGRCLVDIGQTRKAGEVFSKMFDQPKSYKPAQFFQAGKLMNEAGLYDTAIRAYALARLGNDSNVWDAATAGAAQTLLEQSKCAESVEMAGELLRKAPGSAFVPTVCEILSRAYAILLRKQPDEKARFALYEKAVEALGQMRNGTKDPAILAKAEVLLADMQSAVGREKEAIASLQRLVLFIDASNVKLAPSLETAYIKVIPLMLGVQMYRDAMETAEQYLKKFPKGSHVQEVSRWRDEARTKRALSGSNANP